MDSQNLKAQKSSNIQKLFAKLGSLMEDVLSFGSAISACAHGHHWRFSLMLFNTKDADAVACNGAVDACAKVHVSSCGNGDLPFGRSETVRL